MCWRTYREPNLQIAHYDIPIYKILSVDNGGILYSVYFGFKYELNKTYVHDDPHFESMDWSNLHGEYEKGSGFHSYDLDLTTYKDKPLKGYAVKVITIKTKGYGYVLDSIYHRGDCVVVKGYIPKNSRYFVNERCEYVSEKICLTEIV